MEKYKDRLDDEYIRNKIIEKIQLKTNINS